MISWELIIFIVGGTIIGVCLAYDLYNRHKKQQKELDKLRRG